MKCSTSAGPKGEENKKSGKETKTRRLPIWLCIQKRGKKGREGRGASFATTGSAKAYILTLAPEMGGKKRKGLRGYKAEEGRPHAQARSQ